MRRPSCKSSRRLFIKSITALAAAAGLPRWFVEEALAAPPPGTAPAPNDGPGIALVGCGGMGRADLKNAARFGRVVGLCDVDTKRLAATKADWPEADTYTDFRRLLERREVDVVICGTVDHWHTLVTLAAMRAGKDIYCEKPLTLTIDEGKHLVRAQRRTGRVLQTGTQQRSDSLFRLAVELVRNGRIGKLRHIEVWVPMGRREGPFRSSAVPEGFDFDFWLGPTPRVDYVKERTHEKFRYWWDYAGGTVTDWGVHHNDIALWALGLDPSGPTRIEARPRVEMIPGGYTAFSEFEVKYTYANGVTHTCQSTNASGPYGNVLDAKGQQHGIRFEGSEGWIFVTRGKIEASQPELLSTPLPTGAVRVYSSDDHMGNFFDCVQSRKAPIADVETGHRSASICHLGVIALRLGRGLTWDPKMEEFVGDAEANGWLVREMRKPWRLEG